MEKMEIIYENEQLKLFKNILLSEPIDLGTDILEIGVDQFLEEGIIKDIPVLGSVVKVGRTIKTIQDAIFTKKTLAFVLNIHNGNGNEEKWKRHKEKLQNNPKKMMKELEVLLIYLDRHTKYLKSKILGQFYELYYSGEIDWNNFEMMAEILDTTSVFDFEVLKELYMKKYYSEEEEYNFLALKRLSNSGLVDFFNGMVVRQSGEENSTTFVAKITKLGECFFELGLKDIDVKNIS